MPKFRKKPEIVEAFHNDGVDKIPDWLQGKVTGHIGDALFIRVENKVFVAEPGDWVVKDSLGEIYAVLDLAFRLQWEPTEHHISTPTKADKVSQFGIDTSLIHQT